MSESGASGTRAPTEVHVRFGQRSGSPDLCTKNGRADAVSESTEPVKESVGQLDRTLTSAPVPSGRTGTDTHMIMDRGEPAVTAQTTERTATAVDEREGSERAREGGIVTSIEQAADTAVPGTITPERGVGSPGTAPALPEIVPGVGRIPVLAVSPVVDAGRWPAKAVVGEPVPIHATVFREGHDAVAATAVLIDPAGIERVRTRLTLLTPGTDRYGATVIPDAEGAWTFRVEGWSDPYGTWEHDATIKIAAGVDVELMLEEGARLFERALICGRHPDGDAQVLRDVVHALRDRSRPAQARLAAGIAPEVHAVLDRTPLRDFVTASPTYRLTVQRERALFSSWYEMFPRSEGAHLDPQTGRWVSGTFATAARRLPAIAAMGFDIVYLPPIHPVGRVNRKGPNNTLTPGPDDPGSPWAIGSAEGGHDAVHPDLGTIDDFDEFVTTARAQGLEVALDLALQCAPDHPWAREHPEWFTTRVDGTIAYAENPPKKYQDIYPLNFDNDPAGLAQEVLRVVEHWISHGVTIFRVDNPHTKPVWFWEWLIGTVNARHPEVLFLAEAFTRPAMMHTLGKVGFHQSYTYFTWRNTAAELAEYLTELSRESAEYMRPNFWPNTPDILHEFLQYGGPAAFTLRAVLAATMSPSWGLYSGYELCEHVAVRAGSEEYLDSEKYQYRPRDWAAHEPGGPEARRSIAGYITRLNLIRREHPALQRLRNIDFHRSDDENLIVFSRRLTADETPDGHEDTIIVVVNLDPHGARESTIHLNMPTLGVDWQDTFTVHDLLSGATFRWGEHNYVRLDPHDQPAHVLHVRRI
jgi:starch synthase (maltosyl-transferring)